MFKLSFTKKLIFLLAFFVFGFTLNANAQSSYWKNYFSIEERKAVEKNAEKYTLKEIESKSEKWKGIIRGYNIKKGSITDENIKENGISTDKISGLGDYIDQKISGNSTPQDFSADKLTGSYAALDGSQITNLNPANVLTGSMNLGSGLITAGNISVKNIASSGDIDLNNIEHPGTFSASVNTSPGNLNGTYVYRATFVTQNGETDAGELSTQVSPVNQQVQLSNIPISPDSSVIARKIYRSDGTTSGGWQYRVKLVDTITDNTTTTYVDNINNDSLGEYILGINTTGGNIKLNGELSFATTKQTTSLGIGALANNSSFYNTAIGFNALNANTFGYYNTALGGLALSKNITGHYNLAVGVYSMMENTTGNDNTAVGGQRVLEKNTSGYENVAVGNASLQLNTEGYQNTALGYNALGKNTTGIKNIAIGTLPLKENLTGGSNIAIGYTALGAVTSGSNNIAIGTYSAGNSTGGNNIAIGTSSLALNANGAEQVAIGTGALYSATGGENVGIGYQGGAKITTGVGNTFVGRGAGNDNSQLTTATNSMALGRDAYTTKSNQVVIGNSSISETILRGQVGIGTTTPVAALDINGQIKMKKESVQPFACDAAHDGAIALTSGYRTCVCKGGSTSWVFTTDGTTACTW